MRLRVSYRIIESQVFPMNMGFRYPSLSRFGSLVTAPGSRETSEKERKSVNPGGSRLRWMVLDAPNARILTRGHSSTDRKMTERPAHDSNPSRAETPWDSASGGVLACPPAVRALPVDVGPAPSLAGLKSALPSDYSTPPSGRAAPK